MAFDHGDGKGCTGGSIDINGDGSIDVWGHGSLVRAEDLVHRGPARGGR